MTKKNETSFTQTLTPWVVWPLIACAAVGHLGGFFMAGSQNKKASEPTYENGILTTSSDAKGGTLILISSFGVETHKWDLRKGLVCKKEFAVTAVALTAIPEDVTDCRAILQSDLPELNGAIAKLKPIDRASVKYIGINYVPQRNTNEIS